MIAAFLAAVLQCADGAPPPCRSAAVRVVPDSHVIAVLPFRVSGTDSTLAEGLAELLALEYTGEGVQRAADMGTVLRLWRAAGGGARAPLDLAAARRVATRVGAGRLVSASVVTSGRQLTVSAQVLSTSDGAVRLRAGPVQGSADSLTQVLRELAARLIGTSGGVRAGLSSVPTEALRAFIAGRASYRRSEWADAARAFDRAIALDSTFAYATLSRLETEGWASLPQSDTMRMRRLLWDYRDRLDPVRQAMAVARLGLRYPRLPTAAEAMEAKGAVARLAPDNAEVWFALGDELVHRGELVTPGALGRARAAMERALELDSGLSEAALHLSSLALVAGDRAAVRRFGSHALRIAPNTQWTALTGYEMAWAEGRGRRVADSLIMNIGSVPASAVNLMWLQQTIPDAMDTALIEAAFTERMRRATTAAERRNTAVARALWLENRGRPAAAESSLASLDQADPALPRLRIEHALFSGGDSVAAAATAERWPEPEGIPLRQRRACVLAFWALHTGAVPAAETHLAALRRLNADDIDTAAWCVPLLEASMAIRAQRPDARALLIRAESLITLGQPSLAGFEGLALGRLWSALGEYPAAVRAVRRVEWFGNGRTGAGLHLSERLRAEGQWAALAGDTAAARVAYRRYLLLRHSPESSRMAQRDSVVAALERLGR